MSAKRPAAPIEQAAVKRSRRPEDVTSSESAKPASANVVGSSPRQAHSVSQSSSAKQSSAMRNVVSTRDSSAHSSSHGVSSSSSGAHSSVNAQKQQPRAAHSGPTPASHSASSSVSASPQRNAALNVVGTSSKSATTNTHGASSFSNAVKPSINASQASSAALASLLPLLYGASSNEKNLEVAAAQLASGALKQTASGQSQSLLSGLAGLPLGNLSLANLNTLFNFQMAAAMQKLTASTSSSTASPSSTPSSAKKDSQTTSNSHSYSSSSAAHSHSQAHSGASTLASHARSSSTTGSFAKPSSGTPLSAPLNLAVSGSQTTPSGSIHHRTAHSLAASDAPIDLSKKTASPVQPSVPKTRTPAASHSQPSRADSAVPNAGDRERDRHVRDTIRSVDSSASRPVSNENVSRDRDRSAASAEKPTATAVNGEAERQIPIITLSDDEEESEDEAADDSLFDEEFAQVESLSASGPDDVSPADRAALTAARKRLVRELRRTLCDEEARTELYRRWSTHNIATTRDTAPKAPTQNGKVPATQPSNGRASKTPVLQPPAKRDVISRPGSNTTPQPAHAHGSSHLNGSAGLNQQPAHAGTPGTPVPLKVPRVASANDLIKSPSSTLLTSGSSRTPTASNDTPTGNKGTPSTLSSQKTPQLSAPQLQAQLAASKLAIRKQVEKTLAQLAPPKPAVGTDIQFVPSVNYNDLLCLVGLDETVSALQRFEAKSSSHNDANTNGDQSSRKCDFELRTCIQCETDFTPCWRVAERALLNAAAQKRLAALRETSPRSTIFHVCERCATHNQKKTSRNEYLVKLKQTFSQLARDERELDERYSSLIAQAPQSVPGASSSLNRSATHSGLLSNSVHNSSSTASNSRSVAMHNALKEAQQLLSSGSSRGTSSPTPASASSLGAGLSLSSGSPSYNSNSALSAFTAFTAAMSAAASAMKASPGGNTGLSLNAGLTSALGASALSSGLNASALGVGGLNPASLGAALQAFLSLQNPSFTSPSASASRGASSGSSASTSTSSSRPFAQFGSAASAFGIGSQSNSGSGESGKTASDLHRQYYLEMVTKPPVLPSWKK